MKTESTESLSIKRANIVDKYLPAGDQQRYYERLEMHEELIDLINSHSPKVKQLEWMETSSRYFVESPVGNYTILLIYNFNKKELCRLYFNGHIMVCGVYPDEAQALAQADFEKRVMECLDL